MNEEQKKEPAGGIEGLEEDLYSRNKTQLETRERRIIHERDFNVSDEWDFDNDEDIDMQNASKRPLMKTVLMGSIVFFVLAATFSAWSYFKGVKISPENVVIEIQGPALVGGGEELILQVTIRNNNPVAIETTRLIVEYPKGTRLASDIDQELLRQQELFGTIAPGEEIRTTVRAVLFGEENSNKEIDFAVVYTVSGSNADFYSELKYELALSSSPLSLTIDALEEAISGQEVSFTAYIKSNSSSVIKNVMLAVEYPFGFEFTESTPDPVFANRTWYLGDIPPEEEVKVTFTGVLSGQDSEERVFRFTTGLQSETDENDIGAEFINISESLFIRRPFITVDLKINGETEDIIIGLGDSISGNISWINNLPTQIFDGEIEVTIEGEAFNRSTVTTHSGFFRSIDNKIIWTRETDQRLGSIAAGEKGAVSFSFKTFDISSGLPLRNPVITLDVTVRGKRLSDARVPEEIISTLTKEIKIESDLVITSKVLHNTGPLTNAGPIPPRVEQATTYTILLNVLNSSNKVQNGRVVLSLPPYATWMGIISPLSEKITFSTVGGNIIWDLGDIAAGTGTTLPLREIAFQVKLVPSISQIDEIPILVNTQVVSGFDTFTKTTIGGSRNALTTFISESGIDGKEQARIAP